MIVVSKGFGVPGCGLTDFEDRAKEVIVRLAGQMARLRDAPVEVRAVISAESFRALLIRLNSSKSDLLSSSVDGRVFSGILDEDEVEGLEAAFSNSAGIVAICFFREESDADGAKGRKWCALRNSNTSFWSSSSTCLRFCDL